MKVKRGKSTGIYRRCKGEFESMAEVHQAMVATYSLSGIMKVEEKNAVAVLDKMPGTPSAEDAAEIIELIEDLSRVLGRENELFERLNSFGAWCYRLGRDVERMHVRAAEPLAIEGRRTIGGRSKGGKKKAKLAKAKGKEMRNRFIELRAKQPERKKGQIEDDIAKEFSAGHSTVRQYTRGLD